MLPLLALEVPLKGEMNGLLEDMKEKSSTSSFIPHLPAQRSAWYMSAEASFADPLGVHVLATEIGAPEDSCLDTVSFPCFLGGLSRGDM